MTKFGNRKVISPPYIALELFDFMKKLNPDAILSLNSLDVILTCSTQMKCRSPHSYISSVVDDSNEQPWKDPKYLKQKKDYKDYEVYQSSLLLGLINSQATILFERPNKFTKVSLNCPKIIKLIINGSDDFEVASFVEKQCKCVFDKEISEGISYSTAMRRLDKNRKVFLQNFLIDIVRELDFECISTLARNSGRAMQLERINAVNFGGNNLFNKEEIISIGSEINKYLLSLTIENELIVLKPNDQTLQKMLLQKTSLFV